MRSVEVLSTRTGELIGPAEVLEKVGVDPGLVVDYLTLVGDSSDNIAGAKGIGPKSAVALLDTFGSVDNIYYGIDFASDHGDESGLKPAQLASLEELRPRLDGVRALVRMRTDVPLDIEAVFKPRVAKTTEDFMEVDEMEPETKDRRIPDGTSLNQKPRTEAQHAALAQEIIEMEESEPQSVKPASAVAVVEPPAPAEWDRGLEPRSMNDACLLAKRLHDSKMFSRLRVPASCPKSTIMLGRELGMPSMASLRSVHNIHGKHSPERGPDGGVGAEESGLAEHFPACSSPPTHELQRSPRNARERPNAQTSSNLYHRTGRRRPGS